MDPETKWHSGNKAGNQKKKSVRVCGRM